MLPTKGSGFQGPNGELPDRLQNELEMILQERRDQLMFGRERDLNRHRSGSAPPTFEGSLSAVGSLFMNSDFRDGNRIRNDNNRILSEEEIRSHPAYLSYYYSHEPINPRLPPPLLSKEDWRVAQRFQMGGSSFSGAEDWRKKKFVGNVGESSSLFSMQPGLGTQQSENDLMELRNSSARNHARNMSAEWLDRGSEFADTRLGPRRNSVADFLQRGVDPDISTLGSHSRPSSRNAFGDLVNTTSSSNPHLAGLYNGLDSLNVLHPGAVPSQSHVTNLSHSLASAIGSSVPRSTTPEQQLVGRPHGSGLPPVASRAGPFEKKNGVGSSVSPELADVTATLCGLNLSKTRPPDEDNYPQSQLQRNLDKQNNFMLSMPDGQNQSNKQQTRDKATIEDLLFSTNYGGIMRNNGIVTDRSASSVHVNIPKRTVSSANLYSTANSPGIGSLEGSNFHNQNGNIPSMGFTAPDRYSTNQKPSSVVKNPLDAGPSLTGGSDMQTSNRSGNQVGCNPHPLGMDPRYNQLRASSHGTCSASTINDPSHPRNYSGTSDGDLQRLQKAYLEMLLAQNKQYDLPVLGKSCGMNLGYYGNPSFGLGMPYPGNPMGNVFPPVGSGNFQNEQLLRFTSMMRTPMGGPAESWQSNTGGNVEGRYMSSLLDEFKNNKTRSFELSDIVDHVVEFSTDQYGSRFIQQKLEIATEEEKNKIFPEIFPHARTLMTDVFGNYVIQKFFEHGTESQRKELANQISGHVLPLSLQMYGCRVIQKALEVVDVDQQTQMVAEIDGAVMKCVRDQNGNHVIQKCIECIPQDQIQFIISAFYGQVVGLSSHPYGCRVIQRVLERCDDVHTQQRIMDEIMQSVCILAQDQYGNYVIQHVIQHGKPHERSEIISKLAGQIIKMSQQKFASNVVEKCLTFGGPEERQLLVNEMLGSTDENEPLQAMMKDPFGNYVVQKVLETCSDQSLELILSRIKVHLNTLKRYTYGKHIVSRVEKLITTGERRIGLSVSHSH